MTIPQAWKYLVLLLSSIASLSAVAGEVRVNRTPLAFEINRGQVNAQVRYLARTSTGTIFLTNHEIVFDHAGYGTPLRIRLVEALESEPQAGTPTGGYVNYYASSDARNWHAHLPLYREIRYPSIYSGIDAIFHGNGENLEYDFKRLENCMLEIASQTNTARTESPFSVLSTWIFSETPESLRRRPITLAITRHASL